jgi:hypothetical protein
MRFQHINPKIQAQFELVKLIDILGLIDRIDIPTLIAAGWTPQRIALYAAQQFQVGRKGLVGRKAWAIARKCSAGIIANPNDWRTALLESIAEEVAACA